MFLTPLFGEWEECESERASCVKYVNQIQKIVVCGMRRVLKCYAAFLCVCVWPMDFPYIFICCVCVNWLLRAAYVAICDLFALCDGRMATV